MLEVDVASDEGLELIVDDENHQNYDSNEGETLGIG